MKNLILIIATIALFAECSDKRKQSISPKSTEQNTIDALDYANQQRKTDSLEALAHDTTLLKTFEGPAMTPLGDAPKKHGSVKHRKTHSTAP